MDPRRHLRTGLAALSLLGTWIGCKSDGAAPVPDGTTTHGDLIVAIDHGSAVDHSTGNADRGSATSPDAAGSMDGLPPAGQLGSVCTQQNQTCAAGLKCVFLEGYNAPKGTCIIALPDACKSWDDSRCAVSAHNYSVMCGPYTVNSTTTSICFLLCDFNGKSYDCPPAHTCKLLNGFNACVPK
jgi:hypothetical protein